MASAPLTKTDRQLKVPRTDGAVLVEPAWNDLPAVLNCNQEKLNEATGTYFGKEAHQLRVEARESMLQAANRYLATLGFESPHNEVNRPIVMSGHQPTLFHPGVWVKNFAISELAELNNGTAINLVIDNDTVENTQFSFPTKTADTIALDSVPLDQPAALQPWEELKVQDQQLFESFGKRVSEKLSQWNFSPAIEELWKPIVEKTNQANNLSQTLTAARIKFERQQEVENLELPISYLAEEQPFQWFALHLLNHLQQFREVYNSHLEKYRIRNKVRNQQHPVPNLQVNGAWEEAPFWIWKKGDTQRNHVWIKREAKHLILSDGTNPICQLDLPVEGSPDKAITQLAALSEQGFRFRPRALTTTVYARLFLCDLFVHGIGGAKYDEVTDDLLREFYKVGPPQYLILSGTIHLPTKLEINVTRSEIENLKHQIRDLQYHPELHLGPNELEEHKTLLAERQQLLQEQATFKSLSKADKKKQTSQNRARFQRMKEISQQLTLLTQPEQENLAAELEHLESLWTQKQVLENREYPALFYPTAKLESFMSKLREEIRKVFK